MRLALAFGLGIFAWSILEYVIHRWLGHDRRFLRNPFGVEHTAHHSRGNYFAPWWKKAIAASAALVILSVPGGLVFGAGAGLAFAGGLVAYYVFYEALHRLFHVRPGATRLGRWLRKHHFHHHFHDPRANHGVSTPLWDFVFKTHVPAGRVHVPRKLAMPWLLDPATGDVRAAFAADYALAGEGAGRRAPAG